MPELIIFYLFIIRSYVKIILFTCLDWAESWCPDQRMQRSHVHTQLHQGEGEIRRGGVTGRCVMRKCACVIQKKKWMWCIYTFMFHYICIIHLENVFAYSDFNTKTEACPDMLLGC